MFVRLIETVERLLKTVSFQYVKSELVKFNYRMGVYVLLTNQSDSSSPPFILKAPIIIFQRPFA
jgi:hypothetical protein